MNIEIELNKLENNHDWSIYTDREKREIAFNAGVRAYKKEVQNTSEMHELLAEQNQIALIWSIEDVKQQASEMKIKLTDQEAWEILQTVEANHDCTLGVTWITLEFAIDNYVEEKDVKKH